MVTTDAVSDEKPVAVATMSYVPGVTRPEKEPSPAEMKVRPEPRTSTEAPPTGALPFDRLYTLPLTVPSGPVMTGTNSIVIETLPSKMLDRINVDISILMEIGDAINVSDLKLDPAITIINDPSEMLARIAQTSADRADADHEEGEEGEEGPGAGGAEPEVISRGRDEEEED